MYASVSLTGGFAWWRLRRRLLEGAGRELALLLLTDERAEEAMLAIGAAEAEEERTRSVVYGRSDHPIMLRWSGEWQVGEAGAGSRVLAQQMDSLCW